jgi:hypothetical protein
MNGLAGFLSERDYLAEEILLVASKQAIFGDVHIAGVRAAHEVNRHHHQIFFAGVRNLQSFFQMVERVVVAHETDSIAWTNLHTLSRDIVARVQAELVHRRGRVDFVGVLPLIYPL